MRKRLATRRWVVRMTWAAIVLNGIFGILIYFDLMDQRDSAARQHSYWLSCQDGWKDKPIPGPAYVESESTADPLVRNGRIYVVGSMTTTGVSLIRYESGFSIERTDSDRLTIQAIIVQGYHGHPGRRDDFCDLPLNAVAMKREGPVLILGAGAGWSSMEGGIHVEAHLIIPKGVEVQVEEPHRLGEDEFDHVDLTGMEQVPMRLDPDRRCPRP